MEITELCKLAEKYGTDKCPKLNHSYTPYYYELFNPIRNDVKKFVELGIGGGEEKRSVNNGASLRMWRDFFPNAQIDGIDIVEEILFNEERIKTFHCDGTDVVGMKKIIKEIGLVDVFIDDGSHRKKDQIRTANTILPLLKEDIIYIIEDVRHINEITLRYKTKPITFNTNKPDDKLILVKNDLLHSNNK